MFLVFLNFYFFYFLNFWFKWILFWIFLFISFFPFSSFPWDPLHSEFLVSLFSFIRYYFPFPVYISHGTDIEKLDPWVLRNSNPGPDLSNQWEKLGSSRTSNAQAGSVVYCPDVVQALVRREPSSVLLVPLIMGLESKHMKGNQED